MSGVLQRRSVAGEPLPGVQAPVVVAGTRLAGPGHVGAEEPCLAGPAPAAASVSSVEAVEAGERVGEEGWSLLATSLSRSG